MVSFPVIIDKPYYQIQVDFKNCLLNSSNLNQYMRYTAYSIQITKSVKSRIIGKTYYSIQITI